MRKPIIVANWKNHPGSLSEAQSLLKALGRKRLLYKKVSLCVAPPLVYLGIVGERIRGFAQLGAQDLFSQQGTFTGRVGADILKSFGVRVVILGHSESRALGEKALEVSEKATFAIKNGITPLICFGEVVRDSDGEYFEFLRSEIKSLLSYLSSQSVSKVMLAYEPAWAIGKHSGGALSPADLSQTLIFIRKVLSDLYGRRIADKVPLLYGGAVEPSNAHALMRETGVRGFLVGHASLNAKSFEAVVRSL